MKQYIVDAFTDTVFHGNQAAVCVMDDWPSDELMQNIAAENRFSETAFVVREDGDGGAWRLRWFTPAAEIDFCGHATLGTAYTLFTFYTPDAPELVFHTKVGTLTVTRRKDADGGDAFIMDFPAYRCNPIPVTDAMRDAIDADVVEAYLDRDLLLVLPHAADVVGLHPNQERLKTLDGLCVGVTAPGSSEDGDTGSGYDCVSRVFGPKLGVAEDPVTGSTHCMITPYWCNRLGKSELHCLQASERTGVLDTALVGDRVTIAGHAVLFSRGEILE